MIPINASLVGPPPPADTEGAPSIRWFAAIQGIKRNQNLPSLTPQSSFISVEAVKRVVRQIGETQKARRKRNRRIDGGFDRFGAELGSASVPFVIPYDGT
jgi:hypothetical protein